MVEEFITVIKKEYEGLIFANNRQGELIHDLMNRNDKLKNALKIYQEPGVFIPANKHKVKDDHYERLAVQTLTSLQVIE